MEPVHTLPEAHAFRLSSDGLDDIIALEITEVSSDLVVLQLKEETLEGCAGAVCKQEEDGGDQVPVFSWDALQREDCGTQWSGPGATPTQGLTEGQIGEYCGMIVNSVTEEMCTTYTIPEACFGNLELQFYPCDICEASFTDEQELKTHVSDSHLTSGAKRNERRAKAPSFIHKEITAREQRTFSMGFSQPKMPMRKTHSPPLQCAVCGRIFKKQKSLQRHQWYHTWRQGPSNSATVEKQQPVPAGTPNYCAKCGRTFKERKMLDRHRQIYHHNQSAVLHRGFRHSDLLRCCECDRYFGTKETFHRHQCFHLRKQLRAFHASGRKSKGVHFFHCQLCALPFTKGLEFERHIKVTHPEQYRKAAKNTNSTGRAWRKTSGALKDHGETVSQEDFEGRFPPRTVVPEESTAIAGQRDSETVQSSHPCSECGKSFRMPALLSRHQKMYHNKAQDSRLRQGNQSYVCHKCTKCEKTFRTRRMLQKHARMHRKKKALKCRECKRCFVVPETFHRHQCFHLRKQLRAFNASGQTSQGAHLYHCQLCALQFTEGLEFERHVKVTHPEQYKKAAKNKCSAGKTTKAQESGVQSNGKTFSKAPSVSEVRVKVEPKIEDQCAEIGDPSGSCSIPANTEEQVSGTSGPLHQCHKCGRIFEVQKKLDKHQRIYHRDQSTVLHRSRRHPAMSVLRCCECDRHFSTTESFSQHKCFHLRKQLRAFIASGRKSKGVHFFHCQLCTLQFTEGLKFELHVKVTHPEQYRKAAKNNCSAEKPTETQESGVGNNGKTFDKPSRFAKAHVKMTSVEPQVEDQCAEIGDTSGSCSLPANTEEQVSGTSGPPHQCHKCGRIFEVRKKLDKHQRIYHRDQSPVLHRSRRHPAMSILRCCECDRNYTTTEAFSQHRCFHLRKQLRAFIASGRRSTGVNFFHCQLCTLQFTEGLKFELHVKVTHPEQYKKAAKNNCSAEKPTETQESGVGNNGKTFGKPSRFAKAQVKMTAVEPKVEDQCAEIGDTSGSCSLPANTEEQVSGTSGPPHQCHECGRIFEVQKKLDKHQRIYHRDQSTVLHRSRRHPAMSVLRCCECDRHFSTTESFSQHQCFHLRKQLRDFIASGRKSTGVNFFRCQLCTLQFTEGLKFELHVKVTHPEQYKKAAKNVCSSEKPTKIEQSGVGNNGKTFGKPSRFAKAQVKMTRVEPQVEDPCAEIGDTSGSCSLPAKTEEQVSGTSGPLHQCHKCGRIFEVQKKLDKHQRIYHRDQSTVLHRSRHHPAMSVLRCCECDRNYTTTESFSQHKCFHLRKQLRAFIASGRRSTGVNFFHCQLCTLQFTDGLKFELHVKVTHPEQYKKAAKNNCSAEKPTETQEFRVGSNGKTFGKPSSVAKAHVKMTSVEPQVEDQCAEIGDPSASCSVAAIKEEQVSGTSGPLHQCHKCGRIFEVQKKLDKHQRIYHRDQSTVLHRSRRHPAMSILRCCECDRNYTTTEAFSQHKCFHLRKQLRAFIASGRRSTGVNFFHCQLCTLQFTEGLKFELHVKVTHPEQYKKAAKNNCSAEKPTETQEFIVGSNGKTFGKPSSVAKAQVKMTREEPKVEDQCAQIGDTSASCSVAAIKEEQVSGTSGPLHQCHECGRIFEVQKKLDKHQRIYHRDQSTVLHRSHSDPAMSVLRCCECDRNFSTTEAFSQHKCFHLRKQLRAFIASGRKSKGVHFYHCQLCALPFTEGLEFEHHIKGTHPEQYKKAAKSQCSAAKPTKK
ncbi:zinc finger protein 208-like [Conger conger]|uniref:zinc finger protein 208-like n=1 Tax=Conger conger TaxID=82655 RepID=UPI002A5A6A22|nr:zinc finger protein 208-like [Conger conger]XP_061074925.1 zinc finger protein 208-like [Conger conger]